MRAQYFRSWTNESLDNLLLSVSGSSAPSGHLARLNTRLDLTDSKVSELGSAAIFSVWME